MVAVVYAWFKNLNTATGNLGAAKSSDEFFTLAAEHAAANQFNVPGVL